MVFNLKRAFRNEILMVNELLLAAIVFFSLLFSRDINVQKIRDFFTDQLNFLATK